MKRGEKHGAQGQKRWKENRKILKLAVRASGEAGKGVRPCSQGWNTGVRPCSQGWNTVLASKGTGVAMSQLSCSKLLPAPFCSQELMEHQFWFLIPTSFKARFLGQSKYNEHTREEDSDSVKSFNGNWLSRSLPESLKRKWTANSCDLSLTAGRSVHIALPRREWAAFGLQGLSLFSLSTHLPALNPV